MENEIEQQLRALEATIAAAKDLATGLGASEVVAHLIEAEDELRPIDLDALQDDEASALRNEIRRKDALEAFLSRKRA